MAKLIKIAESKDLMPGQGGVFEVEGKKIVVFNVEGSFYAVEDRFHEEGVTALPAAETRSYRVRKSGNEIQVEL